jgi:hypothetical protein
MRGGDRNRIQDEPKGVIDLVVRVRFKRPTQDHESILEEHAEDTIENGLYIARKEKQIFIHASVL